MLHKVSHLTNLTKRGYENITDNNQGEFGLCCFSGSGTFGVMNDHAIYSMEVSISDIRPQVKRPSSLLLQVATFNNHQLFVWICMG